MDREKSLIEKVQMLETRVKELADENMKIVKNKEYVKNSIDFLKKEIDSKQKEIMNKIRLLSMKNHNENAEDMNEEFKRNANLLSCEDAVKKNLFFLQKNYNMNVYEKLKGDIDKLLDFQKSMKVNYLTIKKIDIREEFLKEKKVQISSE